MRGVVGKLRRLAVAHMVREQPAAVPWIVEGSDRPWRRDCLDGREGEGKSLLAMALAAGVAVGDTQAGLVCRIGKVLIAGAEKGSTERTDVERSA